MIKRFPIATSAMLTFMMAAPMAIAQTVPTPSTPVPSQTVVSKKAIDPRLDSQAIICKREESTGSRLGATKECHTRAEWAGRAAIAREQMDRIQTTPQTH